MSTVSVFVPCYKYGHYLRGCVGSILSQIGVDVRVLILDDCSPDNTPEVARELMRQDGRVEYHRNARNLGHIATYNLGIDWCRGDYCLLLSADDMLTPGALARAARVMDERPEVVLTYGRWIVLEGDAAPVLHSMPLACEYQIETGAQFVERTCASGQNPVPTPTAVVRTSVQKLVGCYRRELPHTGDMEMWLRIAAHGSVARLDIEQAFYRWHGRNMQLLYLGKALKDIGERKQAVDCFFDEHLHRIEGGARLRAIASRTFANEALDAACAAFEHGELDLCRQGVEFARTASPRARSLSKYRRMQMKLALGWKLWSLFQPLKSRLTRRLARA